jgi:hypothetical protein
MTRVENLLNSLVRLVARSEIQVLVLIILISAAANLPLLPHYNRFADDYPVFAKSIPEFFRDQGIWRVASYEVSRWLVASHLYGLSAILLHALTGYAFYRVVVVAFDSVSYGMLLAILMVAFPWGYQSLVWASCFSFVMAAALFWFMCFILLTCRPRSTSSKFATFLSIVGLALSCLLCNEAAFFTVCLAGLLVFARQDKNILQHRGLLSLTLAPLTGASLWAVAYELTKSATALKQISVLNFRSLLSGIYYQYANLEVFDLWLIPDLRTYVVSLLNPFYVIASTILLFGAIMILTYVYFKDADQDSRNEGTEIDRVSSIKFFLVCIILLFGSTGIYVLGGGYSLDARKRYFIVPFVIVVVAAALKLFVSHHSTRFKPVAWPAMVLACILGSSTSFMMTTLWQYEIAKINGLMDLIATNGMRPAAIEWKPYLHKIWPRSARSWGDPIDAEWSFDLGLAARKSPPLKLLPSSNQIAVWQKDEQRWVLSNQ